MPLTQLIGNFEHILIRIMLLFRIIHAEAKVFVLDFFAEVLKNRQIQWNAVQLHLSTVDVWRYFCGGGEMLMCITSTLRALKYHVCERKPIRNRISGAEQHANIKLVVWNITKSQRVNETIPYTCTTGMWMGMCSFGINAVYEFSDTF